MSERLIRPARNIYGSLRLPGDKSISHRYALLGGFAEGVSRFTNFSTGADCASTLACMAALGAKVTRAAADSIEMTGVAGRVTPPQSPLDCGNSGSTMRMISGLLAPQSGSFTLIGDASLSRRPMERIRKPLAEMGASIALTDGHAPHHHSRRSTPRHRLHHAGSQRTGQELHSARRPANRRHNHRPRIRPHPRSQ